MAYTFGGDVPVLFDPNAAQKYTFSGVPSVSSPGFGVSSVGNFLQTMSTGISGGTASGGGSTVNTAQINGQTGFITSLSRSLDAVLGYMGSTGDGQQAQQVAYTQPSGPNWGVVLFIAAGVGLVYYASRK